MEKVKVIQDDDGHWFIIPNEKLNDFYIDLMNENLTDSGKFDEKWSKYMTGGDINLVQLYAEM